jgi:hypothetical protein
MGLIVQKQVTDLVRDRIAQDLACVRITGQDEP